MTMPGPKPISYNNNNQLVDNYKDNKFLNKIISLVKLERAKKANVKVSYKDK